MTDPVLNQEPVLDFLRRACTPYHAVEIICDQLRERDFTPLPETDSWANLAPGRYLIVREEGSLAILELTDQDLTQTGLRMAGAHTDSPALKLKPAVTRTSQGYLEIGVEVYGGPLLLPWFDRDLSLAGRLVWQESGDRGMKRGLIDFQRPLAVIPSLAIHLDRKANKGKNVNRHSDLYALIATAGEHQALEASLLEQIRLEHPDAEPETILGHDLFLYDSQPPLITGLHNEFITGSRLDNLLSCFALLQALRNSRQGQNRLILLNNHEEVGSQSSSGALGTLAMDILERLLPDPNDRRHALSRSLFMSVDNAHAVHPNFGDLHDPQHQPRLGQGPIIKWNSNQRYATDAVSGGLFRALAHRNDVECQDFVMRGDLSCGSTIGPLVGATVGVRTLDIGLPSLAMHSIRETAAMADLEQMVKVLSAYLEFDADDPLWRELAQ